MNVPDEVPLISAFVFPYHLGPSISAFAVPLLYHGHLAVTVPIFHTPDVLDWFERVNAAAIARSSVLVPLFADASLHLQLAQREADEWKPLTDALRMRLTRVEVGYSCAPSAYVASSELFMESADLASAALRSVEERKVAAIEFVWRVYELARLLDSADDAVVTLEERVAALPGVWSLLEECYLHRYCSAFRRGSLPMATDSTRALKILAQTGRNVEAEEQRAVVEEQLRFTLFDRILSDHVGDLSDVKRATGLAVLLRERAVELEKFKSHISRCASDLVDAREAERETALHDSLSTLTNAANEVAALDVRQRERMFETLTEDRSLWATVAGLLGAAIGSLPAVVPATLAVTLFASVGTAALRARRERERILAGSPFSFVYYTRRHSPPVTL